ncbi:LOW QUALITY PROTEIN: hypothetical protein HID58_095588 [Brassica napus]|uniref:Secreted protein n=1 Tax=Brassica napus TaxID=3708 RepID=A0ABQ7X352_BRANA|nr:LOW QUALITY PROTEIN: hypothetical protein HID58_095588 [Brassica napus]
MLICGSDVMVWSSMAMLGSSVVIRLSCLLYPVGPCLRFNLLRVKRLVTVLARCLDRWVVSKLKLTSETPCGDRHFPVSTVVSRTVRQPCERGRDVCNKQFIEPVFLLLLESLQGCFLFQARSAAGSPLWVHERRIVIGLVNHDSSSWWRCVQRKLVQEHDLGLSLVHYCYGMVV